MSNTGTNIVDGFRALRDFCKEVALLLKTATGLMDDEGWTVTKPDAVFEGKRDIGRPEWWLPYEFCRFFENSAFPDRLPFIAVNLDDPDKNEPPVTIALLSAGCIIFEAGKQRVKVEHTLARFHLFMGHKRKDDGTLFVSEPPTEPEEWDWEGKGITPPGIFRFTTFGYPLEEISDRNLRQKIIEPLLKLIEDEAEHAV